MENIHRNLILLLLVLFTTAVNSFSQDYLPTSTTNQIVKHTYYALSYAEAHEQAEWLTYRLIRDNLAGKQARTDNFRPDPAMTGDISAPLVI